MSQSGAVSETPKTILVGNQDIGRSFLWHAFKSATISSDSAEQRMRRGGHLATSGWRGSGCAPGR